MYINVCWKEGRNGEWKEKEKQKIKKICFVVTCMFFVECGVPSRNLLLPEDIHMQVKATWLTSRPDGRFHCAVPEARVQ